MTAHILVPAFDTENCSTLSEKTLNYLRETIGFKGVIVADSLVMEGVVKKCRTVDEAAIQALKAGCDILILGGKLLTGEHAGFELTVADVQRIHSSLITLVQSLLDMGKPTVLLIMRDPLDASLFPTANLVFKTFSPTPPSIQAVYDQLRKYFMWNVN
jgi:hypothetical protein